MKIRNILLEATVVALLTSIQPLSAALVTTGNSTPSFDKRRDGLPELRISTERQQAAAELEARRPSARIDYDAVTGAPAWISRFGFLTKPTEQEILRTGDLGLERGDPHRPIKAFLIENAALFGHGPEVLKNATITREFVSPHNRMRTVVWQQQLDGIPVFEGALKGHITQDGRLVNISSRFLPDLEAAAGIGQSQRLQLESTPPISATQAVVAALANLGEQISVEGLKASGDPEGPTRKQKFTAAPLVGEARAELVWLPLSRSTTKLCWVVRLVNRSSLEVFRTLVDAVSGEMPVRQNVTCRVSDASYRVFPSDSPSPFTPGWLTPSSTQPPLVGRQLYTLSYMSVTASPAGWIPDGANGTHGNNVSASLNRTADEPNPVPPVQGSPFRVFDFSLNLFGEPSTYGNAAVVNLFFWCNWMHDTLYNLGFTEAAGNFQDDNFGRGGLQMDRIVAYAQYGADSGVLNNAFFFPDSDGNRGEIWMLTWDGPTPDRDGDFDAEMILHEYTHGLSTRMAGDNGVITALQSQGLGEGWSDFYALALLSQAADDVNGSFPWAGYLGRQFFGLTENYYYGLRRYPYTHDMTRNPLTFNDIDPLESDNCASGAPFNPWLAVRFGSCASTPPEEVHNIGEVWCATLWDARRNLILKHGPGGNQRMLQLVTDGMILGPANPDFIQARDAILEANLVNYCADDWPELQEAFRRRGMGRFASAPGSSLSSPVVESFTGWPFYDPCQD